MSKTQKIYETDGSCFSFDATVVSCTPTSDGNYALILDKTAFFPGGGGQEADTGTLGGVSILSLGEQDGDVIHILPEPKAVGSRLHGEIFAEVRLRKMQNHGGEHIVSGIVNRLYGYSNVGFHMGADDITIDFDGLLDRAQLCEVEKAANLAISEDRRISVSFPSEAERAELDYRSKKALSGRVRIVEIEGFDRCACCAPHLPSTGAVGMIKILDFLHHKGGVRVHLLCGLDALEDYHRRYSDEAAISALLSAKQGETVAAVERLMAENSALRAEGGELRRRIVALLADQVEETEGNICLFEPLDVGSARNLLNSILPKCGGICSVWSKKEGNSYSFLAASRTRDLTKLLPALRAQGVRGGGSAVMIQGSICADEEKIRELFG